MWSPYFVQQAQEEMNELKILYSDDYIVAINKPHGLLVHRSKYADNAKLFAVQELRNQIGMHVWPCHRLDRKTSGVLLFALSPDINSIVHQQFTDNLTSKVYRAIVRGYTDDEGEIDYPLISDKGKEQEAITEYKTINRTEIPVPFGRFETSRYSLIEAYPKHGRFHQIRKHFAHISHPIIADREHGCNKQNRLFKEKWEMTTMLLHSHSLTFQHPVSNEKVTVSADYQPEFIIAKETLGL
jgi:tRNA pseudouridine65 synthase